MARALNDGGHRYGWSRHLQPPGEKGRGQENEDERRREHTARPGRAGLRRYRENRHDEEEPDPPRSRSRKSPGPHARTLLPEQEQEGDEDDQDRQGAGRPATRDEQHPRKRVRRPSGGR